MNATMSGQWRCACGGGCSTGCGCCKSTQALTPQPTANRPGMSALRYRIGTHGSFLQTMKARLSSHVLEASGVGAGQTAPPPTRPLAGLRLRDGSDPSIALLDAWATVADVLTFYQERIANEGYLRTATEMRSMFELSRLVGYVPRPGVASSVYLAFTIDANTPQEITVPQGARAQTVPGQDELPQSFETSLDLKARAAWNRLGMRQTEPQQWADISKGAPLYLAGTQTCLKAGDPLLIDPGHSDTLPLPYRVTSVDVDVKADRTAVNIEPWSDGALPKDMWARFQRLDGVGAQAAPQSFSLSDRIDKLVAPPSNPRATALQLPRSLAASFETTGDAGLKVLGAVAPALKSTLAPALAGYEAASPQQPLRVWALRLQAGLFGRSFPRRTKTLTTRISDGNGATDSQTVDAGEWPIVDVAADKTIVKREEEATLYLDGARDGIAPGSWVFVDTSAVSAHKPALAAPVGPLLVARVGNVLAKVSRADYGGSGDSTGLTLFDLQGQPSPWIRFPVDTAAKKAKREKVDEVRKILTQQSEVGLDFELIRRTTVYAQSELLTLAERPITDDFCSFAHDQDPQPSAAAVPMEPIELDGLYTGLEAGRYVIVSGERSDVGATRGVFASEPVMITSVVHDVRAAGDTRGPWTHAADASNPDDEGRPPRQLAGDKTHTFLWVDKPLAYCYRRDSVAILGNVVKATHGETRNETLGNGDGAKPLQRFELKQSPLTHLPAPTPQGAESTLRVHVNDVRWREVTGFLGQAPTDRVYRVQTDDQGKTTVQFGNGREGARLPTGFGNVKATYRHGIGRPGNATAGQIQQLATRPLGVRDVTNPLRASGGADRESRDQIRRNAPLAVKSLDRLVSTPDYADFSRTFAGIGKADAQEISDGLRSLVHVTVAGVDDIPIDTDSDLMINLRRALRDLGDPFQPLTVAPHELRLLIVSARLRIDPDHQWEPVVTAVRDALLRAFGFEQRELAQGVASSDVLSAIQKVPGVVYVDLDAFGAIDTTRFNADKPPRPLTPEETAGAIADVVKNGVASAVQALPARRKDGALLPAQLALLSSEVAETLVLNQLN